MKRKKQFLLFFLLLFAGAIILGFCYYADRLKEDTYEHLAETYKSPTEKAGSNGSESAEGSEQSVDIPIDFDALQRGNPDIYAWITIPDTAIDYPILQSDTDNSYYLNHTADHQEGFPGSIYTENLNAKDFSDPNTLIYGHNMGNGTMFSGLHQYVDPAYMEEHSEILIYTPNHIRTYRIFAAITYDNRHIMYAFDFSDVEQYQAYFDSLKAVRNMATYWDGSVAVTVDDRIITLSTCNGNDAQRFLVEAVLIDEK